MGMGGFPPTWLRQVSPLLHKTTLTRVVFETEASGGSNAGGLPHPSLSPFPPLPLSIHPKFSDKPVGGKVRSNEGEVPWLPPTNTTLGMGFAPTWLRQVSPPPLLHMTTLSNHWSNVRQTNVGRASSINTPTLGAGHKSYIVVIL